MTSLKHVLPSAFAALHQVVLIPPEMTSFRRVGLHLQLNSAPVVLTTNSGETVVAVKQSVGPPADAVVDAERDPGERSALGMWCEAVNTHGRFRTLGKRCGDR